MCFNQTYSAIFSILGFVATFVVYHLTHNVQVAMGVFYFFLMEFLQFWQYFWIDMCDSMLNKVLTSAGWLHIAFQPFFSNLLIYGMLRNKDKKIGRFILKMSFLVGCFILARHLLAYFPDLVTDNTDGFLHGYNKDGSLAGSETVCGRSTEWIRGQSLCTFRARIHLGWSVPMISPGYFVPGISSHFIMMFFPFFFYPGYFYMKFYGVFLFLSGPVLSTFLSDDIMERGAIWCLLSVGEIICILAWAFFVDKELKFDYRNAKVKKA